MLIIESVLLLRQHIRRLRQEGKRIALVPTMGNLHDGHMKLVDEAKASADVVVVSIFVNPMQFDRVDDLARYPRTLQDDCEKLNKRHVDFVFAPTPAEVYPQGTEGQTYVDVPGLSTMLEGASRPGHFRGASTIVSKLFNLVQPDVACFGEKDFQQLAIIREMVRQMKYPLEIVGCPIVREEDGLALSSRNARLSAEERKNALRISQTLFESRTFGASHTVAETQKFVEDTIAAAPGLRLEYFELVDGNTLQKITDWEETSYAVGCITVFCGEVRLIDNIKYKEPAAL